MPLEHTTRQYQIELREFCIKLERYDLLNEQGKIAKQELFSNLWHQDNRKAIEAIAQGSYPGIMFQLREGYVNFHKQDQEKQRTVIALRARKHLKTIHSDSFSREAVEKLLIEFGVEIHEGWDAIENTVNQMYKAVKK